jgi:hypothetical protein
MLQVRFFNRLIHFDAIISGGHETTQGHVRSFDVAESPENAPKSSSTRQNFFVLDTNVLIHDLSFVEELVKTCNQEGNCILNPG